jgi:hypothetical protein
LHGAVGGGLYLVGHGGSSQWRACIGLRVRVQPRPPSHCEP